MKNKEKFTSNWSKNEKKKSFNNFKKKFHCRRHRPPQVKVNEVDRDERSCAVNGLLIKCGNVNELNAHTHTREEEVEEKFIKKNNDAAKWIIHEPFIVAFSLWWFAERASEREREKQINWSLSSDALAVSGLSSDLFIFFQANTKLLP